MQTSERMAHVSPGCGAPGRPAARQRGQGSHVAVAARRGGAHPPPCGLQQRQRRQQRVHGRNEREAAAGQRAAAGEPRRMRRPEEVGLAQPPGAQQERRRRACARRRGSAGLPPAPRAVEHLGRPPPASAALAGTGLLCIDANTLSSQAPVCRERLSTARRPPAQHRQGCLLPCRPLATWQRFVEQESPGCMHCRAVCRVTAHRAAASLSLALASTPKQLLSVAQHCVLGQGCGCGCRRRT